MNTQETSSESAETVLVLRTCDKDLKAREGFVWPSSGPVSAPDWDPRPSSGCEWFTSTSCERKRRPHERNHRRRYRR